MCEGHLHHCVWEIYSILVVISLVGPHFPTISPKENVFFFRQVDVSRMRPALFELPLISSHFWLNKGSL